MSRFEVIGVAVGAITVCCVGSGCVSTGPSTSNSMNPPSRPLIVELLAIDLSTCGRCTGTDRNIAAAVHELRPILAQADVRLQFRKTVVQTAQQAVILRFRSSPTVRINGRDVAIEFRESRCGDCTALHGKKPCEVDCRVWVWQDREYTEAPKVLIVDAILRAYPAAFEDWPPAPTEPFELPENLKWFFENRS